MASQPDQAAAYGGQPGDGLAAVPSRFRQRPGDHAPAAAPRRYRIPAAYRASGGRCAPVVPPSARAEAAVTANAGRQRRTAAELVRCMDTRDQRGAEAVIARAAAAGEQNLDAVLRWVWRIEAERDMQRRYGTDLARLYRARALLTELIGVVAEAMDCKTPANGVRNAA